jgi:hypothetical protein
MFLRRTCAYACTRLSCEDSVITAYVVQFYIYFRRFGKRLMLRTFFALRDYNSERHVNSNPCPRLGVNATLTRE